MDTWLIRRTLRRLRPDFVHAWGNERGAGLVASRLGWPYLVTIQGLFRWYREALPGQAGTRLPAWAEKVSLSRARHATTESNFSAAYLRQRHPTLTVHQAEHAPNPIFAKIERTPAQRPIRFVTNGTVGLRKGTDLFLRALAPLLEKVDFEALVIGTPNQAFLEPLRASLPEKLWPRVTFKADLSPDEVAQELKRATIFVLPTRADTSPNAVKEAAVAGVPVVASEAGGVPDYIQHGKNGFVFPIGDLTGLIAAIEAARNHPLFQRGEVDAETLRQTRAYLSPQRMAETFFAAYLECAKDGLK
jgi:glycosyltransferase involved in cell wall biosynthesis